MHAVSSYNEHCYVISEILTYFTSVYNVQRYDSAAHMHIISPEVGNPSELCDNVTGHDSLASYHAIMTFVRGYNVFFASSLHFIWIFEFSTFNLRYVFFFLKLGIIKIPAREIFNDDFPIN